MSAVVLHPITNTTERGELIDRLLKIEARVKVTLADELEEWSELAMQLALDILDIVKGTVTVTEQGIPPT